MELLKPESLPFWGQLTPEQRARVAGSVYPVEYEAGQSIRSGERDCLGALLVAEGVVRVYLLSQDGREVTISRLMPGELCVLSAACMLSAITFEVEIEAEEATRVLVVPSVCLSGLMQESLAVENCIYRTAVARFSAVVAAVEQMFFLTLEQRVAGYLLDESARLGTDTLAVTQEQIARAIGSAREAVTRALKRLCAQGGAEVFRGGVRILARGRLYRAAGREEP